MSATDRLYCLVAISHETSDFGDPHVVGYYDTRTVNLAPGSAEGETVFEDATSAEATSRSVPIRFVADDVQNKPGVIRFRRTDDGTTWNTALHHTHARYLDGQPITKNTPAGWPLDELREHAGPARLMPYGAEGHAEVFRR